MTDGANTVLGRVDPSNLGTTLMHEHLFYGPPGWFVHESVANHDFDAYIERAVSVLRELHREHGVDTIVDATPLDAGRDVERLRNVAERTDVNVVCSTGLYPESRGITTYFEHRDILSDATEELVELLVTEIERGIGEMPSRAGVIKVGTSEGELTDYDERLLVAAGRAQRETGVPVITHTEGGTLGYEQVRTLTDSGADPEKIVVGHIGGHDLDTQRRIVESGARVGFDQLGATRHVDDERRYEKIATLFEEGYGDRIVLSHDYIVNYLSLSAEQIYDDLDRWSPDFVFETARPALKQRGLPTDAVSTILERTPQQLFG